MKSLLTPYRVMANTVGVLLIILVLIGVPLRYGHVITPGLFPKGGFAETLGSGICMYLGIAHGWLYMIFLVTAFALSRRAHWSLLFTATTLLAGTVPILSFWAERRATADVRRRLAAQDARAAEAAAESRTDSAERQSATGSAEA